MHCICFATLIIKQQILSITAFVLLCDHINAHDPNLRRGWGPESHRAWKISRVEQEQPCSRQGWNNGIKQRDTSYLFPVLVLLMISLFLKLSEQNTLTVLVQFKHCRLILLWKTFPYHKIKCMAKNMCIMSYCRDPLWTLWSVKNTPPLKAGCPSEKDHQKA